MQAAAQKALAGEIDARAARLAAAADDQFVLASDGTVRWVGAPVGKLVAGDNVLRPRVRLIADEQLTGAPREQVQARLDLWLKTHIDEVARSAVRRCRRAEDVTGIARGIAFQLVEALGVLERQKVAEEVKGLDQAGRAALRKYGIRFGAYHLYRAGAAEAGAARARGAALVAEAWQCPIVDGARRRRSSSPAPAAHRSRSTRRSPKALYRTARLSRLRRTRRARRHPGAARRPDPSGAGLARGLAQAAAGRRVRRRRFHRDRAMTSLTGAAGEDFASILRSLGYRMEQAAEAAGGRQQPAPSRSRPPSRKCRAAAELLTPGRVAASDNASGAAQVPEDDPAEPSADGQKLRRTAEPASDADAARQPWS